MYFNYHAKVQNLIKQGYATGFEIVESYHGISPCMLIYFNGFPPMPIRQHKFDDYYFLLFKMGVSEILNN